MSETVNRGETLLGGEDLRPPVLRMIQVMDSPPTWVVSGDFPEGFKGIGFTQNLDSVDLQIWKDDEIVATIIIKNPNNPAMLKAAEIIVLNTIRRIVGR